MERKRKSRSVPSLIATLLIKRNMMKSHNTQLSSTGRPVCGEKEEIEERTKFDRDTLDQEKHDEVTDPTSTGRDPYVDTNPQNVAC